MTIEQMLERAETEQRESRTVLDAKKIERKAITDGLKPSESLTVEQDERFNTLTNEIRSLTDDLASKDSTVENLKREQADEERLTRAASETKPAAERVAPAVITAEPSVYSRGASVEKNISFFRDMYQAQETQNLDAQARQARYRQEIEVERRDVENGKVVRAAATSSFAGLIPPQYLVDEAALIARAGRPTANIVRKLPLPDEGMSLIIPRGTTGASAAVQASENSAVSTTDEVWANVTVPVATIAGYAPVSRQTLERGTPGIDSLIFADLQGAYAVALDQQVLSGTGSSGQMLGILATAGVVQGTAFGAAITPATFLTKIAGAINQVETTRFAAPDVIIMHPRRWNWLTQTVDSNNRPLVVPNANGPQNALASFDVPVDTPASTPVGWVLGLPVITDASIPTAVGTGPEDQVIVARRADLLLWEVGDGSPIDLRFEQTAGNQLQVQLVAYGYAAFTAGRYPTAASFIGGNVTTAGWGLINPTF